VRLTLDVAGDRQLARELLRVGEHGDDVAPALRQIADYWRDLAREQFATEGASGSGGWPPLAPATVQRKRGSADPRVRRNAETILVATGALREGLTDAGDEQHVERVTRDELEFGTLVDYVGYHQHGTSRAPQRRPVELTETERRETMRRLQRWVLTGELV